MFPTRQSVRVYAPGVDTYLLLGAQQAGLLIDCQRLVMALAMNCIILFNELT